MAEILKYKINEFLKTLPRSISMGSVTKILKSEHNISADAFYRDRSTKLTDDFSIPSNRMDVYAALFGVTVDKLKNFAPKKIKPLADRKLSKSQQALVVAARMVKRTVKLLLIAFLISSCVSYKGVGKCPSYKTTPMQRPR